QPPGGGGSGSGSTPRATTVSGSAGPAVCGDGWCNGSETCVSCPGDCGGCYPTATPRPWDADEETLYHCVPWGDCPDGWADTLVAYHWASGRFVVVDVTCLSESTCVAPTPQPGVTPTPGNGWPCDYPPTVDASGVIRQPCERWPGWSLHVEVRIPPSGILRNPWPRGLVGMENCFWYLGNADNEKWSEEALECPDAADGVTHDSSVFECGDGTTVAEGATANYQIGVAWRQWRAGSDPVFGQTPPDEITWVFQDREWNGGETMKFGPNVCYTFETSSFGLEEFGPVWNPECQEEQCSDCDDRILDYLGSPSYQVNATTFWWPEYT
ncbi:MAG: hypothetical protein GY842_00070, partial [bacterium]|nr:hypothetical protein [bacterium]